MSTKTTRVDGYTDERGFTTRGRIIIYNEENAITSDDQPCVLFISSDGSTPEVMEVEKVKEMLKDCDEAAQKLHFAVNLWHRGGLVPDDIDFDAIAAKYGITL